LLRNNHAGDKKEMKESAAKKPCDCATKGIVLGKH
jgi:hypothetical protein